jgi:arylsulfatase A-like enzyme
MAVRPKNVVLLWTDQQRADTIAAAGNPQIQTPHLDRLAATGALFQQAYCAQPRCSPARASLLTGVYPHTHGVVDNNIVPDPSIPMLGELLQPAGYVSGYNGKWHLGNELHAQRGFDPWVSTEAGSSSYHEFLVSRGYTPADPHRDGMIFGPSTAARMPEEVGKPAFQTAETSRFLETHGDQPFLLSVSFREPHAPFTSPLDGFYRPDDMTLPESWYRRMEATVPRRYRRLQEAYAGQFMADQPQWVKSNDEWGWKELKARYWGLCTLVDKYVGRILGRLEELGLADNTIVVYTSDHGHMMGEHRLLNKSVPYEPAVQIPLIMRVPGLAPRRLRTPVSHVDLVPTILDLLGQPLPTQLHGASLVPLLARGDTAPEEADVFIEWNGPTQPGAIGSVAQPELRTIRRGRWKLNVHVSGEHELYDLADDPGELHNAFGDPGHTAIIRDLAARLQRWQQETDDPVVLPPTLRG